MSLSQVLTLNTANASSFTYDSAKIDIISNGILKDLRPANAIFYAALTASENGNWGDGALTGTLNGGATIAGGYLNVIGAGMYLRLVGTGNVPVQKGAIRFKLKPNYTGTPANTQVIVNHGTSGSNNNLFDLRHNSGTGAIFLNIKNSSGSDIINYAAPAWSPTAGVEYDIEVNFDLTVGLTKIFINGAQHGATQISTGIRSATAADRTIGAKLDGTIANGDFELRHFVVYDEVQNNVAYTGSVPLAAPSATIYAIDNPTILHTAGILMDSLSSVAASIVASGSDAVKAVLNVDGQDMYYNSGWGNSDGTYSQSNTIAELNTNAATLSLAGGKTVKLKLFLHSNDGSTSPSASSATLGYSFAILAPTAANKCLVYCYLKDLFGTALSNSTNSAKLVVELSKAFIRDAGYVVGPMKRAFNFDANGYVEAEIEESASVLKNYSFSIEYLDIYDGTVVRTISLEDATVPDQASIDLLDLTSVV